MKIIESKEIIENGITYIVETFDNGTINKYIKPDDKPPEPKPTPTEPTTQDIMDKLDEMSSEQVSKKVLDEAYKSGVNAI